MNGTLSRRLTSKVWHWAAYAAMIITAVIVFLLVRGYGERLVAAPPAAAAVDRLGAPGGGGEAFFHVLLALAAVIATGRVLGRLLARLGQPPVIGEVIAGILFGPSLLGRVAPDVAGYLLPPSAAPFLGVVANLGVILYMFQVGLHLDGGRLRDRAHTTVIVSHASIVVPFVLGAVLALHLYPMLSTREVSFTKFALFLGVSMSVTAFPVLARILTDRQLHETELGVVALTCAAADDVTAWCLLAFVVGIARADVGDALLAVALTLAYIAVMLLPVRRLVGGLVRKAGEHLTPDAIALALVGMLLSSLATEIIGIHAIFGAFLAGALIPHDSTVARALIRKLDLVAILLLPAFFAYTGMRTQIGLVTGTSHWLTAALIVLVATAGKFGGTLAAARASGMSWRDSASLGVLMNTRGLMELIVLNVGLDLGVISPTLFAMLVLMALATTLATTPALNLLTPRPVRDPGNAAAARASG